MMTKITTTRQRAVNLYTVEQDGQPVAQAEAISQAEAVRLYVESQQQPTLSARLATPRESRELAHLPLLSRGAAGAQPERDPRVPDLFDDAPAAPTPSSDSYLPDAPLGEFGAGIWRPAADHVEDVREMVPPPPAPIAAVLEGLASGEPEPSAPSTAAPTVIPASAEDEQPGKADGGLGVVEQQVQAVIDSRVRCNASGQAGEDRDAIRAARFPSQANGAGKVGIKYRNPATGEMWSGRGLTPRWLVVAQEAGRTLDEFLIEKGTA